MLLPAGTPEKQETAFHLFLHYIRLINVSILLLLFMPIAFNDHFCFP